MRERTVSAVTRRIGVRVNPALAVRSVEKSVARAQEIERLGFGTAWMTNGGPEDCIPLLGALATKTTTLGLGTAVMQTYPRHPYVLATEANVIDQLAPGRFRLGIGPTHAAVVESLGLAHDKPVGHLREYIEILRTLTSTGVVAFDGQHYRAHSKLNRSFELPILVGTLQAGMFELAGRLADGAITWLCPPSYVRHVGLPHLERGATDAGRTRPPLIAHVAATVCADGDAVRAEVRKIPNIKFPSYQRMLVAAGYPEASRGQWTDSLVDGIVAWGREEIVISKIQEL